MNSSPGKNYTSEAIVELKFYREKDTAVLSRKITLPPHGFEVIKIPEDKELNLFFGGTIGWCTIVTNQPYLTTYYFSGNSSGFVGGDHGF